MVALCGNLRELAGNVALYCSTAGAGFRNQHMRKRQSDCVQEKKNRMQLVFMSVRPMAPHPSIIDPLLELVVLSFCT